MKTTKILFLLIVTVQLCGCFAGKAETFDPTEQTHAHQVDPYKCGDVTLRPNSFFSNGFVLMHYIVPLWPIFPSSKTESDLEFKITIYGHQESFASPTKDDVLVKLKNESEPIKPYDIQEKIHSYDPEKPWFYKKLHFFYKADRNQIDEFEVIFPNEINGCSFPPVIYKKNERVVFEAFNK